jgi:hypothetical protein
MRMAGSLGLVASTLAAVGMAFAPALAGRALSAYNLVPDCEKP